MTRESDSVTSNTPGSPPENVDSLSLNRKAFCTIEEVNCRILFLPPLCILVSWELQEPRSSAWFSTLEEATGQCVFHKQTNVFGELKSFLADEQ